MACFHRIEDVALDALLRDDSIPHVGSYWDRLQARPSYTDAIVNWHGEDWRSAIQSEFRERNPLLEPLVQAVRTRTERAGST